MTTEELKQHKGKILTKCNCGYTWMFKLIDVDTQNKKAITINGINILPRPNVYAKLGDICGFNTVCCERYISCIRVPTKEEMNLYRKYTREIKLLGTNKSKFGEK